MENIKIKVFSKALKYLIDMGLKISEIQKSTNKHWSQCLRLYLKLISKVISQEMENSDLMEKDYLSKCKIPFIAFYNENPSFFECPTVSVGKETDEEQKMIMNDEWLRLGEQNSKDECNGIAIYLYPGVPEKKFFALPISEMYDAAIFLHKSDEENAKHMFPLRILYGFFLCLYYSLENVPNVPDSITHTIEAILNYDIENDIEEKLEGFEQMGSLINQLTKSLGIDSSSVPKEAFSMKNFQSMTQKFINSKETIESFKTGNIEGLIGGIMDSLKSNPETSSLFPETDLLDTIPKENATVQPKTKKIGGVSSRKRAN